MTDLTLNQIRLLKANLEREILLLLRKFEIDTNTGIEKIEINEAYEMGLSHSLVVNVDIKLNI